MATEDFSHTLGVQGRDGGDQHPDDKILEADDPEVQALLGGLQQDDDELKDEEH